MQSFLEKLVTKILTRYPFLADLVASKLKIEKSDNLQLAFMNKKLRDSSVALVTTAGVHLKKDAPFDMKIKEGDVSFRIIPDWAEKKDLTISHNHYDHTDADKDINIVFPLEILKDFARKGLIGKVAPRHFGFMGSIYDTVKLVNGPAREVAELLKEDGVDIALLSPA